MATAQPKQHTNQSAPEENNEDYDPHFNRDLANPTSDMETLYHVIKGCLGTGILAMPEAFKHSGMINGIISTILIGIFCTYCLHVLVRAQYILCKKNRVGLLTYPEAMRAACQVGPKCMNKCADAAPIIINIFLIANQVGVCCVYVVFAGVNVKAVIDTYVDNKFNLIYLLLLLFLPFFVILCVNNLKSLAPFSIMANLISFITFGVVLFYVSQNLLPFSSFPAYGKVLDYPLFVGTTLFSIQSIGVITSAENNMATPQGFRKPFGVLNIGMLLVVIIYVVVAMMGYWRYGDKIESSITLNFPEQDILAQIIRSTYSIAIWASYGLNGYVPLYILWTDYIGARVEDTSQAKKHLYQFLIRVTFAVLTFALAMAIPLLGLVISLVGGFFLSFLGIALPALMEICAYWPDMGKAKWVLWKNILLILIGIFGLTSGTYSCLRDMIKALRK